MTRDNVASDRPVQRPADGSQCGSDSAHAGSCHFNQAYWAATRQQYPLSHLPHVELHDPNAVSFGGMVADGAIQHIQAHAGRMALELAGGAVVGTALAMTAPVWLTGTIAVGGAIFLGKEIYDNMKELVPALNFLYGSKDTNSPEYKRVQEQVAHALGAGLAEGAALGAGVAGGGLAARVGGKLVTAFGAGAASEAAGATTSGALDAGTGGAERGATRLPAGDTGNTLTGQNGAAHPADNAYLDMNTGKVAGFKLPDGRECHYIYQNGELESVRLPDGTTYTKNKALNLWGVSRNGESEGYSNVQINVQPDGSVKIGDLNRQRLYATDGTQSIYDENGKLIKKLDATGNTTYNDPELEARLRREIGTAAEHVPQTIARGEPTAPPGHWPNGIVDSKEPPVAPGHIRLYRGVTDKDMAFEFRQPLSEAEQTRFAQLSQSHTQAEEEEYRALRLRSTADGKHYTDDIHAAMDYAGTTGKILYVDVPVSELADLYYNSGLIGSGRYSSAFYVPHRYANAAREDVNSPTNMHTRDGHGN